MGGHASGRPRTVLESTVPPTPSCRALRVGPGHRDRGVVGRCQPVGQSAGRRDRVARLRGELALHLQGRCLRRGVSRAVTRAALLVAGDRGAVLHRRGVDRGGAGAFRAQPSGLVHHLRHPRRTFDVGHGAAVGIRPTPTACTSAATRVRSSYWRACCSPSSSVSRSRRASCAGRAATWWSCAAAVAMLAAFLLADTNQAWLYHGGFWLVALGSVLLIVGALDHGPLATGLSWRPLAALGLISYGVYLYHWPIFVFITSDRTGLDGVALAALRLAITLGAGGGVLPLDRAARASAPLASRARADRWHRRRRDAGVALGHLGAPPGVGHPRRRRHA